ncbi:CDP-glucose 4,6-dehydratase [Baekduia alba]|uniref:CDP-glucose 4,6-dehydratase n=1 Tax=Baekduia alba TaxID=2997333 RepID=UPI002341AFA0|nr:CDP-glucose 4,6-dehydratase [Baekduia alba]
MSGFWQGRRVLVTGHTGFKGAWLTLWLLRLGAEVTGFAHAAEPGSLHAEANLDKDIISIEGDVRDLDAVVAATRAARPELLLHLAAQPLVRRSYAEPVATYATNVMGTVHVLEAARAAPDLRAALVVTSDKCYDNSTPGTAYAEDAPLGGHDPYSSSKGAAELVAAAYRASYDLPVATARAGNVIGGGDWAPDRIVPDAMRAFADGRPLHVRNPHAIRPWQHVLNCLDGYLTLAERLHDDPRLAGGFNFGPPDADARSVEWIVARLCRAWGDGAAWAADPGPHPHEAHTLRLDSSKARAQLRWTPRWDLPEALERTVAWHRAAHDGADARALTLAQLDAFAG